MKKQTGIWLDLRNAWIITLPTVHNGEIGMKHVPSEIEETAFVGGSSNRAPWGPHGGNNQGTVEERRHHEEKNYFANIIRFLDPATDEVVIFGPSEARHGLRNLLATQHQAPRLMGVEAADQMTEHQMEAWVRAFYHREAARKRPKLGAVHS